MGFDMFIKPLSGVSMFSGSILPLDKRTWQPEETLMWQRVDEKQRPFLSLRGGHLHAQIQNVEEAQTSMPLEEFYQQQPSWQSVKQFLGIEFSSEEGEDTWSWTEADHDNLQEALTYFMNQPVPFEITWSY